MLMKKILCVILSLVFVFSFVACTDGNNEDANTSETSSDSGVPVISLVNEKTAVEPGEEVQIELHVKNAPLTACFDIYIYADEMLEYITSETVSSELILASNQEEADGIKRVVVRGMVAATYDILDDNICTVTYKVSEKAPSGTKLNLTVQSPMYQVGLDESGNDVYSVSDKIEFNGLVLEVQ